MREDEKNLPLEKWATPETLDIAEFSYDERQLHYSKIYQRRFRDYPEEGYAYLEDIMSGKEPGPGYSILATILATDPPRHNAVITTNFDNLVADALSIYTDTFPFVCGHESLAGFVRTTMRRPLICKIHRDLLLAPKNDPRNLRRLNDQWGIALSALFEHYTPIFIGYGGNDDTLMDLLESLQPGDIKGQPIWCYYNEDEPDDRIVKVVHQHKGVLVPCPDFDLLMVLLGEKLGIGFLDEVLEERAALRQQKYRERISNLSTVEYPAVAAAMAATFARTDGWWAWHKKAQMEADVGKREAVYLQAIDHLPHSSEMHNAYGMFLHFERGEYSKAIAEYRTAIELQAYPPAYNNLGVIHESQGERAQAKDWYTKATELAPNRIDFACNYAEHLIVEGRYDEAAIELDRAKKAQEKTKKASVALALNTAILSCIRSQDDTAALEHLTLACEEDVGRYWTFDHLKDTLKKTLAVPDRELYLAIIKSIEAKKVPDMKALKHKRAQSCSKSTG